MTGRTIASRPLRLLAHLLAAALVVSACSGESAAVPSPTPSPSPSPSPTPSPTPEPGPISPLNGAELAPGTDLDRRAIGVKIDNHPSARPQVGLAEADVVVEILVEGGLTRLLAVFHSRDPDGVGPIRSGRPTDASIAAALGAPLAISGAQGWVQSHIVNQGVDLIGHTKSTMYRTSSRRAPHNLMTDLSRLRGNADSRGLPDEPPQSWLPFGPLAPGAEPAASLSLSMGSRTTAGWAWKDGSWQRSTDGAAHATVTQDGEVKRIRVDTVLVLEMKSYTARPPGSGSSVPATETVGSGPAWVFADGKFTKGTWKRDSITDAFELVNYDGRRMPVPPGRLWVELLPAGRTITIS
ncbi:MAG: DUF3048 domain-containing protein [Nitriliruptorales bacterium]|nr:DUF3048 domain-containing protein [Nitriliruptorales bacterium]